MKLLPPLLFLGPLVLGVLAAGEDGARPVVEARCGKVRGVAVSAGDAVSAAHAFYGVPFAKPPVGPSRFAAPQPAEPWSGVREASDYPPMCLQDQKTVMDMMKFFKVDLPPPTFSEDCLYLNIFTPASRDSSSKLPVMVFIHGGGLRIGGAAMFEGSALSMYEDVVVVSIQYRLGALGFLSTADGQVSGNFGFLDQVEALRWVQRNILDFGGDPESVTIFGESAGAVSVSALTLSPLTGGLFHRAIAESGSALMLPLMAYKPHSHVQSAVAELASCDPAGLLTCLRNKSQSEMVEVAGALGGFLLPGVTDGEFLQRSAEESLAQREMAAVPLLLGVNNHECGWMLPLALNVSGLRSGMEKAYVRWGLGHLRIVRVAPDLIPPIMDHYFTDTEDPLEIRNRFLELCGDLMFTFHALRTAAYHRDAGRPVFLYEFQHRPSLFKDSKPDFVRADHGDELFFVVGGAFLRAGLLFSGNFTEAEKSLSKVVMKYWANFARNGDPNGPGLVRWPKYDQEEDYLQINLQQSAARKLRGEYFDFWTKLLRGSQ